ncbi:hypothetical protein ACQPZ2_30520 [Nocardia pseudovaccinii]|uniref:hypothetical protein n=1 Tax=Nocardia pseudovaccinii TaxID=189540 RepID=UPI003D93131B
MRANSMGLFLNGAFICGFAIDAGRLTAEGYAKVCRGLAELDPGWDYGRIGDEKWYWSTKLSSTRRLAFLEYG